MAFLFSFFGFGGGNKETADIEKEDLKEKTRKYKGIKTIYTYKTL